MSVIYGAVVLLALAAEPDPFIPEAPPQAAPRAAAQPAAAPRSGVHITLEEWDALKDEIRTLKAENAELRKRLESAAGAPVAQVTEDAGLTNAAGRRAAAAAAPPTGAPADVKPMRRNYTGIEVGMTRQEVDRFIKSRRDLKIVSVQANSGVQQRTEETVVQRSGTTGQSVTYRGGPADRPSGPPVTGETQAGIDQQERQVVQRKVVQGKRETITVAQVFPRRVQQGTQRNSLGGSSPVYGTVYQEAARLTVELTDDVVTAVNGTLGGRNR